MKLSSPRWLSVAGLCGLALTVLLPAVTCAQGPMEAANEAPWFVGIGAGAMLFEGDEEVQDGLQLSARLGYDYNEWWTIVGQFMLAPDLKVNDVGHTTVDDRGNVVFERVKLGDFSSTWGVGLAVDALFHFTRWERVDPFLAFGAGVMFYGEKFGGDNFDPALRVGGGVMYHYNDEWALRVDGRTFVAGGDTEANATIDAGVVWTWGAHLPPDYSATGGPLDSDGDGLTDAEELELGTDPYDPDTDKDRLTDGQEVKTYRTDPLNPDTDWDLLQDGDEVIAHNTDPLKQDTDNGGVSDGHEVIEDDTDPLNGADDLTLYTLKIEFDTNEAVIKPQYFRDFAIIGKVLSRNPESTAVVEGHADKRAKSSARYNKKLSQRRAQAVLAYIVANGGIDKSRLEAVGYGFDRPMAPNDPVNGSQANRRVEVYIRGIDKETLTAEERQLTAGFKAKDK